MIDRCILKKERGGSMPASQALLKAIRKYDDNNTIQFKMKLNKGTDADIIEKLESVPNKQGYIKKLIRNDIEKELTP